MSDVTASVRVLQQALVATEQSLTRLREEVSRTETKHADAKRALEDALDTIGNLDATIEQLTGGQP